MIQAIAIIAVVAGIMGAAVVCDATTWAWRGAVADALRKPGCDSSAHRWSAAIGAAIALSPLALVALGLWLAAAWGVNTLLGQ